MSIRSAANQDLTLKNVDITQQLLVKGDTELQGSLKITGNLLIDTLQLETLTTETITTQNITTTDTATIENLVVNNNANIQDLTILNNFSVINDSSMKNLTVSENITTGSLNVNEDVTILKNLYVDGTITCPSLTIIPDNLSVVNLNVSETITANQMNVLSDLYVNNIINGNNLMLDGYINANSLIINQDSTINGNATVNTLLVNTDCSITENLYVGQTTESNILKCNTLDVSDLGQINTLNANIININGVHKMFDQQTVNSSESLLGNTSTITSGEYLQKLKCDNNSTYSLTQHSSGLYGNESIIISSGGGLTSSVNDQTIQSYYLTGDSGLSLSINPLGGSVSLANSHKLFEAQIPNKSTEVFLGNTSTLNTGSYLQKLGLVDGTYSLSQMCSGFYGNQGIICSSGGGESENPNISNSFNSIQSYYSVNSGESLPMMINPISGSVNINTLEQSADHALNVHGSTYTDSLVTKQVISNQSTSFYDNSPALVSLFIDRNVAGGFSYDDYFTIEYSCIFTYNEINASSGVSENSQVGQTVGNLMIFPGRFYEGMGTQNAGNVFNINNQINGNSSFYLIDVGNCPLGRPYYTMFQNQATQLTGIAGGNAFLTGDMSRIQINFMSPSVGKSFCKTVSGSIINSNISKLQTPNIEFSITSGFT